MKDMISTDYIVIGGGIAGLSIAIELVKFGHVTLLMKSNINSCSTYYAQGGIAAVYASEDTHESHINDTIIAGQGLCNKKNVSILVKEGTNRIKSLLNDKVLFTRDKNNNVILCKEGAHTHNRIFYYKDSTGKYIFNHLLSSLKNSTNITIIDHAQVVKLLVTDNQCYGCCFYKKNKLYYISAQSTILASGGNSDVYQLNTCPTETTGDGIFLAFQEGANVTDMEFMQFHPTVINNTMQNSSFLVSEAVRGEGGILVNQHGDRFMNHYHKDLELAPRDIVSKAIFDQMHRQNNKTFLDVSLINFKDRFPNIFEYCIKTNSISPNNLIPVSPAAHYLMGGIKTSNDAETSIDRLFAIGEVSSFGIHGANRLASNSLLDGLVFSYRAANKISELRRVSQFSIKPLPYKFSQVDFTPYITQIKEKMWNFVGIQRSEKSLMDTLSFLDSLPRPKSFDIKAFTYQSLLCNATLITLFSIYRKESRGAHYRLDYPNQSSYYQYHQVYNKRLKKPFLEKI
ncbi:L-aspartate oxidase [Candidatus Marinamargulisbacteria bacterium SCGC AG-410-N11]|nr:L-aspartate oxidase [Candidatus Marinamargulisbacteria bacterium SCGC AG-410-N11]